MILRDYRQWVATGVLITLLVFAPLYLNQYPYQMAVVTGAFFYAILASSWSLLAGTAGQFSFAHMALMTIGAYTSGLLGRDLGTSPLTGILLGTLLAGIIGLFIGLLCLRLRGAYLALFTIAFSEILRIVLLTEFKYTEGSNGLELAPLYAGITAQAEYYITLALLLGTMALMYWLISSRFGLFIRAMREDEDAAAAMGVNVVRYKILVFVITSMIVGLAGGVFYHQVGIITPNTIELLQMSLIVAMAVIGGMESLFGAAVGAIVSRLALELLREINILGLHIEFGAWRFAAFGLILVFTLRFAQNGLLHPIIDRLFLRRVRQETVAKRINKGGQNDPA
ncbi:MAG: branched-chain amino acid ABC transporter permease [Chloroflexi bacterium]|nr:branched-chain amino acid ABC transporter permease [Chloroflexota bacterium]MBU1660023.1 branched-chain amino acid ABC transporter permease [Chloroflexota bacterium]